ncbi:MAG TPA: DUF3048 domain-containing protein [Acidimicrobiia bacterium]|nr:DUF3048 domain-containing protein [Acidimicrobiia bacterium]
MIRRLALLLTLSLVAAACGGDAAPTTTAAPSTTTTMTSTTTTSTTTTTIAVTTTTGATGPTVTTLPEGFRSPINGLHPDLETLLDRRGIAVKVDNHPEARPQSGIQLADGMIEILVEGGFTRFIALFHDNDTDYIGPIRSIRPTDSTLIPWLDVPLAYSGGQPWVRDLFASRSIRLIGEGANGMFRISSRTAPQNLYGDTNAFRTVSDQRGYHNDPPNWLYEIGLWDFPDEPATEITIEWSSNSLVRWVYEEGKYLRFNGSSPHRWRARDGSEGQVSVDVLVTLTGHAYTATPPSGVGTPVPATETVGSGKARVFAYGLVWEGTWERSGIDQPFQLFSADGTVAVVPPGVPWVSILPDIATLTYE